MRKNQRNRGNKKKDSNQPSNKSETAATSGSNTTQVEIVGKKTTEASKTNVEKNKAIEKMLLYMSKLTVDDKNTYRSTEDIRIAKNSRRQRPFMTDEETRRLLDSIEDSVRFVQCMYEKTLSISSSPYQSILESYPNAEHFLMTEHTEFFKNSVNPIRLDASNISRLWDIFYSSSEKQKPDDKTKRNLVLKVLKTVRSAYTPKDEDAIKATTDLGNDHGISSVGDTPKQTSSPQEFVSCRRQESFMTDEETRRLLDSIEDTVRFVRNMYEETVSTSILPYQSILVSYPNVEQILLTKHTEFFTNSVKLIRLDASNINRLWNIFYSSIEKQMPDDQTKRYLVLKALKAVKDAKTPKKEDTIKATTDLGNDHGISSVGHSQKPTPLPQELTVENKCKIEGNNENTVSIQKLESSLHDKELECKDEILMKIVDCLDENADLENEHGISSIGDSQKPTPLAQKLTMEKKCKKEGDNKNSVSIQELESSLHDTELECNDEALRKTVDSFDERKEKATDGSSELKHTNEMANLGPKRDKRKEMSNQEMRRKYNEHFKSMRFLNYEDLVKCQKFKLPLYIKMGTQDLEFSEKRKIDATALEEIKAPKEQADKVDDLIRKLKKVRGNLKGLKEYKSSDYMERAGKFPLNKIEEKKERKYVDATAENIQEFHLNKDIITPRQEIEYSNGKTYKDKMKSPEKRTIKSDGGLKFCMERFISQQKCRLDKQINENRDMGSELMSIKGKRDLFSLIEGSIRPVRKTESREKTRDATDLKDVEIKEVALPAESYDKPNEIVELDKKDKILFNFETDRIVGTEGYEYSLKEKQAITFNFKDEKIQISFTGNQIFVTTENSEFDILIQKSEPVNLTSEATQTDTLL